METTVAVKTKQSNITSLSDVGYPINPNLIGYDYKTKTHFMYDIYTTNLSFIQTSRDLKNLGVKNNKFFLKLYDPSLVGVDPYSKSLTQEQIKRIIIETVRNPWYYLREISRIPEEGGALTPGSGIKYQLHRGNLAATYLYLRNINFYFVIPRQCGKTQSVIAILLWSYLFGTSNSEMSFINKDQDAANGNLKRMKEQRALLPDYLQQKYVFKDGEVKPSKGTDAIQKVENPTNGNRVVTKPKAATLAKAENIGRGNTSPIQYFDEVEFTSYVGIISKASGPAYIQSARNAAKNGAPYCRIYTTTVGNVDTEPVESSKFMRELSTLWTDKLLDISDAELLKYLNQNSRISMFYIEFSYRQIGRDEPWFQSMCKELGFDKMRIRREVLLQRIRGTSDSPFDPEDLETINGLQKEVIEDRLLNKIFSIHIYEKINPNIPYIIGVDCSTGTNNDNTAITVIDPYNERAIAEAKSPLMSAPDTCTFLRLIIRDVCPRGILAIERNSLGEAVIQMLKLTECRPNLYYDSDAYLIGTPDEKLDAHGFIKREAENERAFGVYTSGKSREMMIQIMMRLVQEKKEAFALPFIINDMNNLVKKASGKIEARSGEHDDNIMSFLIAMFVRYHGKKLVNWGFVPGGTPLGDDLKPMTYEDVYDAMPDAMKELFPAPPPKEDTYQKQLKEAIRKSQQERMDFSNTPGITVKKTDQMDTDYFNMMYGDSDYGEYEDDFFRELNS